MERVRMHVTQYSCTDYLRVSQRRHALFEPVQLPKRITNILPTLQGFWMIRPQQLLSTIENLPVQSLGLLETANPEQRHGCTMVRTECR